MAKKKQQTLIDKYVAEYPWIANATYLSEVDMYIVCIDPASLNANPKNWRTHSQRQRSTFNSFKDKYGWLNLVIYNMRSLRLLDGHMRVDEAVRNKEEYVPVRLVDLDEQEENEVLATFDNIGLMAQRNNQALQSLLQASNTETLTRAKTQVEQKLQQLRNDLSSFAEDDSQLILPQSKKRVKVKKEPEPEIEESDEYQPTEHQPAINTIIDPTIHFEGLSEMGIPTLLPEKICSPDLAPTSTYIGEEYDKSKYFCYSGTFYEEMFGNVGTIGFYTEDYKFEATYTNPDEFVAWALQIDPVALVTPDFSSYTTWPLAKNLWALYRSRWLGRLWQEAGLTIIPTVQILDSSYKKTVKYVLETLVAETVSIECRLDSPKDADKLIKWINTIVDVVKPKCMVLYAGQEKQKYIHGHLRKKVDYRYLPQVITAKRNGKRQRHN